MPEYNYQLLEVVPEAILMVDPLRDRIVFVNDRCRELLKSCGEFERGRVSELFHRSLPELINFTEAVICRGRGLCSELIVVNRHDDELLLEVQASLDPSGDGILVLSLRNKEDMQQWRILNDSDQAHRFGLLHWPGIQQVFQDIEKKNALILGAAGEGIYGIDCEGKATFVNPAAEKMLGWKADELIGVNIHSVIHHTHQDGSDFSVYDCPIYAAFRDGAVQTVQDDLFWKKDGKPLPVEYTSTPIIENHQLVGAVVIFRDISERKIAEKKLRSALAEVETLKKRLELENAYLQEEISENYNRHQIIGKSPAVQKIIDQVQLVAPTGATVLITGESGTGKELIARAIHNASPRKDRALVRVNCAAIPRDLFESEFFGHTKGAFSGATSERRGRFEVADGGTLFLDEVGELPLELQGKLLRALQDGEFERVGESRTRTVDVRVIAATNRDLKKRVNSGAFREDLFFRLNVFPVHSIPLRERKEDIPLLVSYFLKKSCKNFNKPELTISVGQMQRLQQYSWPGNIRELENVLERQVILSRGDKLVFDSLPTDMPDEQQAAASPVEEVMTEAHREEMARQAAIRALKKAGGKIYGDNGAAMLLGLKPTTLASRLKKWNISKDSV